MIEQEKLEKRFGPLPPQVLQDADLTAQFAQNEAVLQEVEHDLEAALHQLDELSANWQMTEAARAHYPSRQ